MVGTQGSKRGWIWAMVAGSCAAGAAIAAKLASPSISFEVKLLCYAAAVGSNVLMWSCYTKSLVMLSSLQATVVNFAANFLLSGVAGWFLFGEKLTAQWFLGACFIILGILVLSRAGVEEQHKVE